MELLAAAPDGGGEQARYQTTDQDRRLEIKATDRIGTRLVKRGIVGEHVLQRALQIQAAETEEARRRLGAILVAECGVSADAVAREIASMYGFQEVELSEEAVPEDSLDFAVRFLMDLPEEVLAELREVPLVPFADRDRQGTPVRLVTPVPTDPRIVRLTRQMGLARYELLFAPLSRVRGFFDRAIQDDNRYLRDLGQVDEEFAAAAENETEEVIEIHHSALTNLVEGCLLEAVRRGASDIHILPSGADGVQIRFRVDGRLQLWLEQNGLNPEAIIAVVKDRARNVDRFERDAAQDGYIQRQIDGHNIRFRVSILPIVGTEHRRRLESAVLRVLDDRKLITDLEEIGFLERARRDFEAAVQRPQGIIILTGPTGSGKSTTLVAALHRVLNPTLNAITVEDPVEYIIPGARQVKLNPKLDFEQALRAILRHDPDIVMVGEMRDKTTADIAIKLANTGHLTFSTLHTNDAPSAVSRLYKLGIEPFLIAHAINIIVAQRLVRTLCTQCRRPVQIDPAIPMALGFSRGEVDAITFYEAIGCPKCAGGYRGRAAIHETLLFNKEVRRKILDSKADIDEDEIRAIAVRNGAYTLRQAGLERIRQGVTTCEEVAFATASD
jgi:type IV pilus assembly protein PilB